MGQILDGCERDESSGGLVHYSVGGKREHTGVLINPKGALWYWHTVRRADPVAPTQRPIGACRLGPTHHFCSRCIPKIW